MAKQNLLELVRVRLADVKGEALLDLAHKVGCSYDTLLRIRNGTGDPGFSVVQALADRLRLANRS